MANFHDLLKARALTLSKPLQILRRSTWDESAPTASPTQPAGRGDPGRGTSTLVRDFELMLGEVLERFRDRYDEVFNRLDQLLAVAAPTRPDAVALRQRFRKQPGDQTLLLQPGIGGVAGAVAGG